MSIVVINTLVVPPERRETLEQRFAGRAGTVESADGFEWFELLRPVEGTDRYLVYTRWRSRADFEAWDVVRAHAGGPSGPPAVTDNEVWSFEVVQSAGPVGSAS